MQEFVKKWKNYLTRRLTPMYINWLIGYIVDKSFITDNPSSILFRMASEKDREYIRGISQLFSIIMEYCEYNNIEVIPEKKLYDNSVMHHCFIITVNLDEETTVEMITWLIDSGETQVRLVAKGSGKINIDDVRKYYNV